jgi:hypothetical protein
MGTSIKDVRSGKIPSWVRVHPFSLILKKYYLKISKNLKQFFSCTYYGDTYLCHFSRKNTIIFDLPKNDKNIQMTL